MLHGFTRPCVLDLKLGTRLYDDDATPEKREKMQKNAKGTTSEELGIRISGMKVGVLSTHYHRGEGVYIY